MTEAGFEVIYDSSDSVTHTSFEEFLRGTYGATIALHANHDPSVFGGPDEDQEYVS